MDAHRVGVGEVVGAGAVEVSSQLREAGKEVGVAVCQAFSVF